MRDKMTKIRAVLFIYLTFQAGIAQALQLKDLIAEVVENNLEIQKMQYELESERQSLLSSQHLPHTSLDLYGGAGAQRNYDYTSISDKDLDKYSAGIVLTHKLFDGHYADSEIDRHKASFSAKTFLLESEAENITLDTIELFLEILKLAQISDLSTEFLGVSYHPLVYFFPLGVTTYVYGISSVGFRFGRFFNQRQVFFEWS